MINVLQYGNNIKAWWDYNDLKSNGYYVVIINGKKQKRKQTFITVKNLDFGTTYSVSVYLVIDGVKTLIGEQSICLNAPKRVIDVTKAPYFANGDGETLITDKLQKAIDDCGKDEEVFFPDGIDFTGALNLHSTVTLHLSKKAIIRGSESVKDYLPKTPSRFEGTMRECYRSLINCGTPDPNLPCIHKNVKIYGGTIEGGGNALREDTINLERSAVLKEYGFEDCVSPPTLYYNVIPGRARGRLIQVSNTENFAVIDCNLRNAPAWSNHFIFCRDVVVCGCKVYSRRISNGDGIDPDSTENCTFFDIKFFTGDDSIAIKSGKNAEGERIARPTKNVKVFSCKGYAGHGMAIGSEMSGGVEDVHVWDCDFLNTTRGIHIKTDKGRGGYVKNVKVDNCSFSGICISMAYGDNNDGESAKKLPVFENFVFKNVTMDGVMKVESDDRRKNVPLVSIIGLSGSQVKGVLIDGLKTTNVPNGYDRTVSVKNAQNVLIKNIEILE